MESTGSDPIILIGSETLNLNKLAYPEELKIKSLRDMLNSLGWDLILVMANGDRYKLNA